MKFRRKHERITSGEAISYSDTTQRNIWKRVKVSTDSSSHIWHDSKHIK